MLRVVKLVSERSSLCPQIHLSRLSRGSEPLYITVPCVGKIPIDQAEDYLYLFFTRGFPNSLSSVNLVD